MTTNRRPVHATPPPPAILGFRAYRSDIGDYMRRWILQTPIGTVRLHHILRSDAGRYLHDHPWSFVSVMLRGAYIEETPEPGESPVDGRRLRVLCRAPSIRFRRATAPHRLDVVRPVWTLVFTTGRGRDWGFYLPRGWTYWRHATPEALEGNPESSS